MCLLLWFMYDPVHEQSAISCMHEVKRDFMGWKEKQAYTHYLYG